MSGNQEFGIWGGGSGHLGRLLVLRFKYPMKLESRRWPRTGKEHSVEVVIVRGNVPDPEKCWI